MVCGLTYTMLQIGTADGYQHIQPISPKSQEAGHHERNCPWVKKTSSERRLQEVLTVVGKDQTLCWPPMGQDRSAIDESRISGEWENTDESKEAQQDFYIQGLSLIFICGRPVGV